MLIKTIKQLASDYWQYTCDWPFSFFFFKWTYIDMERKCRENTLGQTATNSFRMSSLHFNQEKEEREDNNRAL